MDELERLQMIREMLAGMGLGDMDEGAGVPTDMPPGSLAEALERNGGWGAMEGVGGSKGKRNMSNDPGSASMFPRGMLPSGGSPNKAYDLNDIMDFIKRVKAGGSHG